jgi:hypothetical protein
MRKSSEAEQQAIDQVLDLVDVEADEVAGVPPLAELTKTRPVVSCSAACGIFGRILAKQDSEESKGQGWPGAGLQFPSLANLSSTWPQITGHFSQPFLSNLPFHSV